jgi:pilus assembly protein Flp/PilA
MHRLCQSPGDAADRLQREGASMLSTYIRVWLRREEGQALVEYALIVSLIALVAIAALTLTGTNVLSILSSIATNL